MYLGCCLVIVDEPNRSELALINMVQFLWSNVYQLIVYCLSIKSQLGYVDASTDIR